MTRLARPREGAAVTMDMQCWNWPNLPHAKEVTWLEATKFCDGYELRGPQFGGVPYGNGAMHVMKDDVVWLDEQMAPLAKHPCGPDPVDKPTTENA